MDKAAKISAFLVGLLIATSAGAGASVGEIESTRGEVVVKRDGEWIVAKAGQRLNEKDSIETARGGMARFLFEDGTLVTIGSDSHFAIRDYLYEGGDSRARFSAAKGAFRVVTGEIGKIAPKNFTLTTRTATMGIRGTVFHGIVGESADKIMCSSGAVVVSGAVGDAVEVPAGRMVRVAANEAPGAIELADFDIFPLVDYDSETPFAAFDEIKNAEADDPFMRRLKHAIIAIATGAAIFLALLASVIKLKIRFPHSETLQSA